MENVLIVQSYNMVRSEKMSLNMSGRVQQVLFVAKKIPSNIKGKNVEV